MPSTYDHSAGLPTLSSPRSTPLKNSGQDDLLHALAAQSAAAADYLLASTDWAAHDALVSQLAAQSDRAARLLIGHIDHDHLAAGTVSVARHDDAGDIHS